jgi:hypothetical protein
VLTEIERLKTEVSVERLAEVRGIKLLRHGADLIGLCPFHEDHEPALVITPSRNPWHCLGACRAGGSVIDWVMKTNGVSFRHAVELLRANHPSLAVAAGGKEVENVDDANAHAANTWASTALLWIDRYPVRQIGHWLLRPRKNRDHYTRAQARLRQHKNRPCLPRLYPLQNQNLRTLLPSGGSRRRRDENCAVRICRMQGM